MTTMMTTEVKGRSGPDRGEVLSRRLPRRSSERGGAPASCTLREAMSTGQHKQGVLGTA